MIVVGTAGHIDHGKSAIVQRLTGTHPDRLPEEKARGMTIDLGFAFKKTNSGEDIAFVDVPGHERFVKNMIAGVGGIDVVMLIIAADDGWMPQSEEHFQIIRMLGVKSGLIVINKIDLVEPDWLALLQDEIKQKVSGSVLEQSPIFEVSAVTGDGFDLLENYFMSIDEKLSSKQNTNISRLYIDRSFVRQGIGQVGTGTLKGGTFSSGQTVSLFPANIKGKIRSLQSQGAEVKTAHPGFRTAISVTGADKKDIVRGGVITSEMNLDFYKHNSVLSLSAELLENSPIKLTDRRRILLLTGTTEVEGEIRLLDKKAINPSESGILFFKPDHPIYSLIGDRYIMRLPTPMVTIGGGKVMDFNKDFPKKREYENYQFLHKRIADNVNDLIQSELEKLTLVHKKELLNRSDISRSDIEFSLKSLIKNGKINDEGDFIFETASLEKKTSAIIEKIKQTLNDKPHLKGLTIEEISRITAWPVKTVEPLLNYMMKQNILSKSVDKYNILGRGMSLKGEVKKAHDEIMTDLKNNFFTPPKLSGIAGKGKAYREAIKFIIETNEGHKCGSEFVFITSAWDEIIDFIKQKLNNSNQLTVSDLKEKFGFSRKFTIPILEETDNIGLTLRNDDIRIKGSKFES